MRPAVVATLLALTACATPSPQLHVSAPAPSPYLLVFAGDHDEAHEDFLAVFDVRPGSAANGRVVATKPIGTKASMPHHLEYELPPPGMFLFGNAHHHEETILFDTSDPRRPDIIRKLKPPSPFRFTHDYKRLPNGNVLVGFLRSEGASPESGDATMPGGHGGIAEYTPQGALIRSASAAVASYTIPIRPYAFAVLLDQDRIVTTSARMMEKSSANVVQIWRYSDLKLLHTIDLPPGRLPDGTIVQGATHAPFAPRVLADGSVFFNAFGCGIYHLTGIVSDRPHLANVYTVATREPKPGYGRGACTILVIVDNLWVMPVGREHVVVTLDITDPKRPREVARFQTPGFNPHWLAEDPLSNRIVVGAEFGGEEGMLILQLDRRTGQLKLDPTITSGSGRVGYINLKDQEWPHGASGPAWGHAALFHPGP